MNKFKAGDRVKRTHSIHEGMKVGDVGIVKSIEDELNMYLIGYSFAHDPQNFELVKSVDEKENISNFLREQKWFIRTGSPEKSKLVQAWLFEHGYDWLYGKNVQSGLNDTMLTNTDCAGNKEKYIMFSTALEKTNAQEVTLEFETVVKSVKLPETPKPTEQELRIIELEKTIAQASAQIKQLKEIK